MLFFKECRKILFSLTFLIYLVAVIGFYFTQFSSDCKEKISKPVQGLADYGFIAKEVPEILMPEASEGLVNEYLRGYYIAYPIGFYKEVKLSEKKSAQIAEIITEITGITKQELDDFADFEEGAMIMMPDGNGEYMPVLEEAVLPEINIPDTMTYEHFRELMRKADKIIGGGSKYSDDKIISNFSEVPRTYEDALADYNDVIEKDRITGAYARLFCDYMGIIVSILPVFAAAALANADKKSRMEQLIYSRKISSAKLVLTRFTALITLLFIPVIILALLGSFSVAKLYSGNSTDFTAIIRMSVYWLLPNILFSTALGMVLTEIFSPLMAVFVQGVIWVATVMGSTELTGDIGRFSLVCRHNSLTERYLFIENLGEFVFSRIFYTVLSLAIIILTIWIYSMKRKGGLNVIHKNSVRKSKA
ncbi:MAG: ABC transporter permease [Ruminococcus flavefaciens]|nr:ABC transporter permease [Ruminococcus flavefaciens]MCM1230309.1 ABC transporter permease [Ruminococcus flavefaciens]